MALIKQNPTVSRVTLAQKQTSFHSNGRVSNIEFLGYTPRNSKWPLLKGNYVHRDVVTNLDPKYSKSTRFNT